jgi:hypothetical protein
MGGLGLASAMLFVRALLLFIAEEVVVQCARAYKSASSRAAIIKFAGQVARQDRTRRRTCITFAYGTTTSSAMKNRNAAQRYCTR